ncbi:MAG: DUF1735 domain-containing protein [Bacteroides sp.]|nr:DUF1735 domain-containing protein [Bacteroides sp.]MCM1413296.1 DUF1735 domain-containing protein [Bacteroides sp.]MCM1471394.1 DUF1735 domain-containing protein [Bacteroides sp.]
MNYRNIIKQSLFAAMVAMATTACNEEVNLGNVQAPDVNGDGEELLYISDANGSTAHSNLEFRQNGTLDFYVNATAPHAANADVTVAYDPTVLEAYNKANNTSFEAIPQNWVSFSNSGVATLTAGESTSSPVTLSITSDGSLDHETTYAVPLRFTSTNGTVASMSQSKLVFVKDLTALADCAKTWTDEDGNVHEGIKIFSVMEVNDTNPLNNLRFTLKNSGKYMVDALVMFSGNINYNTETGRVYFYANPNVQHLLDNHVKYLKPLKDRGMKVIMGVMCNHDRACISNLADNTARLFAQELTALCDAYDLDGIFWDDEYCSPISPAPEGFTSRSNKQWSLLAYEFWKLNPNRINVAYGYSMTNSGTTINGVQPGVFIQYVLPDYSSSYRDYSGSFPGMPRSGMGGCSMEFAQGRWSASETTLRNMRNDGYGAMMVFAMDPFRDTASGQEGAMGKLARAFYDDEVVVDPTTYAKDW